MRLCVQCMHLALLRFWRYRGNVFCQVLAISAMLLPLVVLLGLKFGILSTMKEDLLKNPEALEIWFSDVVQCSSADAERYRSWPETGFVLPCVNTAYSTVEVLKPAEENSQEISVDITPTAPGDPLLKAGGVPVPGEGEVVLSEPLAELLAQAAGSTLHLCASRNSRREKLEKSVRVVGVLPRRFCQRSMLYAPAEFCMELEEFLVQGKGEAHAPVAVEGAVYDGVLLRGAGRSELAALLRGVLPALKEELTSAQNEAVPEDALLLCGDKVRFTPQQMQPLLSFRVENADAPCLWVRSEKVIMEADNLPPRELHISCVTEEAASPAQCLAPPRLLVNPGEMPKSGEVKLLLESPQGTSEFYCVAEASEAVQLGHALAEAPLLALLQRARQQKLVWNYKEGGLRHPVVEFVALRMYAVGLDSVEPLMKKMRAEGRDCRARLGAVQNVLQLERNLDLLFLLLSVGVGVGAILSFGMSLFHAVELYRRDFALVQLLGAGRLAVAFIPVTEAILTTLFALLISFGGFELMRCTIAYAFAGMTDARTICRLEPQHWLCLVLISLGVAWVASWASVWRVLRISPADIFRES